MAQNEMAMQFDSRSSNEGFARVVAGAFALQLNPTLEELSDIKTAVSEAVTNAIIHGYPGRIGRVEMRARIDGRVFEVIIADRGVGIEDVAKAREPLFTTGYGAERSGMGFTMMETFMDELEVESAPGQGTTVRMLKRIGREKDPEKVR
ncbi:MAG: anti-sigma F factor [Christensenellales bacterium]|jgi:stage II sporulation protein AB (anti-sigma F factor)|nr:anti-sigma F factor [Clostridiales bacterium]